MGTLAERKAEAGSPLIMTWAALIAVLALTALRPRLAVWMEQLAGRWPMPTSALLVKNTGRPLLAIGIASSIGVAAFVAGLPVWPWLGLRPAVRILKPFALIPLGAIVMSSLLLGLLLTGLWFMPLM